jgi:hypothetical protein
MFSSIGPNPEYRCKKRFVRGSLIHKLITTALLGVLFSAPVCARQDMPLTLAEAEALALVAEPGQQALEARAAALDEQAVVAGELPDPMLRVGLNNFPLESGGFSTEGMTQAMIGYRQAFPAGKTRSLSNEKFERLSDGMRSNANARGRDVLTATRRNWLELYLLQRSHQLVHESRAACRVGTQSPG